MCDLTDKLNEMLFLLIDVANQEQTIGFLQNEIYKDCNCEHNAEYRDKVSHLMQALIPSINHNSQELYEEFDILSGKFENILETEIFDSEKFTNLDKDIEKYFTAKNKQNNIYEIFMFFYFDILVRFVGKKLTYQELSLYSKLGLAKVEHCYRDYKDLKSKKKIFN